MDSGVYENNVALNCMYKIVNDTKVPDFYAKKCTLVGIEPTGSKNGEWGNLAKCFVTESLIDRQVFVNFKVNKEIFSFFFFGF
jgi:hypothetical protein